VSIGLRETKGVGVGVGEGTGVGLGLGAGVGVGGGVGGADGPHPARTKTARTARSDFFRSIQISRHVGVSPVQPNRKFLRDAGAFRGIFPARIRAVAQLGRALEWGSRGPGFKSRQPDFLKRRQKPMNPHWVIDAHSLAMDRLIAQRLRENPAVLDKARTVLAKWMTSCDASVRPVFEEWRAILDGPISGVFAVLEGVDERSTRLRQSSPFCGILSPAERASILMSHAHDAGNQTNFAHPTA
jgi:hypothetical protein